MRPYNLDKISTIFQVIISIIVIVFTFVYYGIPEFKKTFGSSDSFINTKSYNSIIELKLSSGPNFAVITNSKKEITNILFFNDPAICLYNKGIENKSYSDAINQITEELQYNSYLQENTIIQLIEYPNNKDYLSIREEIITQTNSLNVIYQELTTTIPDKLKELSLASNDDNQIKTLENYSKTIINQYKEKTLLAELNSSNNSDPILQEEMATYSDNIYLKLENYAINVAFQEINDTKLPIQLIPADNEGKIYPSLESWYYINNHKVYAYIELKDTTYSYSFCYNGNINSREEGKCQ